MVRYVKHGRNPRVIFDIRVPEALVEALTREAEALNLSRSRYVENILLARKKVMEEGEKRES